MNRTSASVADLAANGRPADHRRHGAGHGADQRVERRHRLRAACRRRHKAQTSRPPARHASGCGQGQGQVGDPANAEQEPEDQHFQWLQPARRQGTIVGAPHPGVAVPLEQLVEGAGAARRPGRCRRRRGTRSARSTAAPPASKAPAPTVNSTSTATRGLVSDTVVQQLGCASARPARRKEQPFSCHLLRAERVDSAAAPPLQQAAMQTQSQDHRRAEDQQPITK